jgi:hypothetical protein
VIAAHTHNLTLSLTPAPPDDACEQHEGFIDMGQAQKQQRLSRETKDAATVDQSGLEASCGVRTAGIAYEPAGGQVALCVTEDGRHGLRRSNQRCAELSDDC